MHLADKSVTVLENNSEWNFLISSHFMFNRPCRSSVLRAFTTWHTVKKKFLPYIVQHVHHGDVIPFRVAYNYKRYRGYTLRMLGSGRFTRVSWVMINYRPQIYSFHTSINMALRNIVSSQMHRIFWSDVINEFKNVYYIQPMSFQRQTT